MARALDAGVRLPGCGRRTSKLKRPTQAIPDSDEVWLMGPFRARYAHECYKTAQMGTSRQSGSARLRPCGRGRASKSEFGTVRLLHMANLQSSWAGTDGCECYCLVGGAGLLYCLIYRWSLLTLSIPARTQCAKHSELNRMSENQSEQRK